GRWFRDGRGADAPFRFGALRQERFVLGILLERRVEMRDGLRQMIVLEQDVGDARLDRGGERRPGWHPSAQELEKLVEGCGGSSEPPLQIGHLDADLDLTRRVLLESLDERLRRFVKTHTPA